MAEDNYVKQMYVEEVTPSRAICDLFVVYIFVIFLIHTKPIKGYCDDT